MQNNNSKTQMLSRPKPYPMNRNSALKDKLETSNNNSQKLKMIMANNKGHRHRKSDMDVMAIK